MNCTAVPIGNLLIGQKSRQPWHAMPSSVNVDLRLIPVDLLNAAIHPDLAVVRRQPGWLMGPVHDFNGLVCGHPPHTITSEHSGAPAALMEREDG